jgi:hypothetical protein
MTKLLPKARQDQAKCQICGGKKLSMKYVGDRLKSLWFCGKCDFASAD